MPVMPVMNFQPETFEQANPWFEAMKNLQGIQQAQTRQSALPEQLRQADLLRKAQIQREQALASSPFGGHFAPGAAGQVQGLEAIRLKYGENSPQYQEAKNAFHADMEAKKARSSYYGSNVSLKYLPQFMKLKKLADEAFERGDIDLGRRLLGASQKYTSDTQTRSQARGANQLLQETNKINLDPITHFTGIVGRGRAGLDAMKGFLGMDVPQDYIAYRQFKQFQMPMMIDTIRKALQTSVMPSYLKSNIQPLADPTSYVWNNPATVRALWRTYKDWLNNYSFQMNKAVAYGVNRQSSMINNNVPRRTSHLTRSFGSKKEFEDYYHSLSPEQRQQFREQRSR